MVLFGAPFFVYVEKGKNFFVVVLDLRNIASL